MKKEQRDSSALERLRMAIPQRDVSQSLVGENHAGGDTGPGDAARLAAELDVLCALCNTRASAEQRFEIVRALGAYRFSEPEHQVVFEAISALSRAPEFSASTLTVQLNNRGFPDLGLEKYFTNQAVGFKDATEQARRLASADGTPNEVR